MVVDILWNFRDPAKNWLLFTNTPAETNPNGEGRRARCVVKNTLFRKTHRNAIMQYNIVIIVPSQASHPQDRIYNCSPRDL